MSINIEDSEEGKFPGRWVAHYKNGLTIIEDKRDGNHWFKIPKEDLINVGILLDPRSLIINLDSLGPEHEGKTAPFSFPIPEAICFGSSTHRNRFLVDKEGKIIVRRNGTKGKIYPFLRVINITAADGTCTCMEIRDNIHVKIYTTNVYSLGAVDYEINEKGEVCGLYRFGIDMNRWRWDEGWENVYEPGDSV